MSLLLQVTGTYSDASTADINQITTFQISDNSIAFIEGDGGNVYLTPDAAGKIWGATIGLTATLAPAPSVATSIHVVALDSGTFPVGSNVWGYPKMPQLSTHWQALGLSPWEAWFGCQELTGNLVGSGSSPFTLTAAAGGGIGVQYGQSPAGGGWLRKAVQISGSTGMRVVAASGTGPNAAASMAILGYISVAPSAPNQGIFGIVHTTPGNRRYFCSSATSHNSVVVANAANSFIPMTYAAGARLTDRVHPMLVVHDATNSQTLLATDVSIFVSGGANDTITNDGDKGLGNITGAAAPSASMVWMSSVTGSVAESYASLSGAADLLSRLGWNVAWKDCPTDSSSIKLPFLPSHWAQIGQQAWTATWTMQECASPLATIDKWVGISQTAFNLNAGGAVTYENKISNWTRNFIGIAETSGQRFSAYVSQQMLIDPTGSFAMLLYAQPTAPVATARSLGGIGNNSSLAHATQFAAGVTIATGLPTLYSAGITTTGSVSVTDGLVHPILMVYDKTNSRAKLYTDYEKVTGSFGALSLVANITASISIGGTESSAGAPSKYCYAAICTGTLAESFSDDGKASNLLKNLGWTITW